MPLQARRKEKEKGREEGKRRETREERERAREERSSGACTHKFVVVNFFLCLPEVE